MSKNHKTSNIKAQDVLAALLKNGFNLAADRAERSARPTERKPRRETRSAVNDPSALTSNSGKSVYLTGAHAVSGAPVTVFMSPKGMMTAGAVRSLENKTGLEF